VVGSGEILGSSLTLDADKALVVGDTTNVAADGTLTLDGGELTTGTLTSSGTIAFISGTLTLTNSNMIIQSGGILGGNLVIDRAKTLQPKMLFVGFLDDGELVITDGGTVTVSDVAAIAPSSGGDGNVLLAGIGSTICTF